MQSKINELIDHLANLNKKMHIQYIYLSYLCLVSHASTFSSSIPLHQNQSLDYHSQIDPFYHPQ